MTQQYIRLPRGAKRVPKKHIMRHAPGLTMPKPRVDSHDSNYAVMDTWGQAMADMKKHGTWPMDKET